MTRFKVYIITVSAVGLLIGGGLWLYGQQVPMTVPQADQTVPTLPRPTAPLTVAQPTVAASPATTPAPTVATPAVTPSLITVNTPTTVTVTVKISPTPITGGVNLLRLGATGTQPTILGVMHDDGLIGDGVSGDGIYTLQVSFNEPSAGAIQFEVSAAFPGQLRRFTSTQATVSVWQVGTDSGTGISFAAPPSFSADQLNDDQGGPALEIRSSQKPLLLAGGALPPGESENNFAAGFGAVIDSSDYNTNGFNVHSWFQATSPGDSLQSISPFLVSGLTAYTIVFTGEIGAGQPVVVIPVNNKVWSIGYESTYQPGTPEDLAGLNTFYLIVQSLKFPQ